MGGGGHGFVQGLRTYRVGKASEVIQKLVKMVERYAERVLILENMMIIKEL